MADQPVIIKKVKKGGGGGHHGGAWKVAYADFVTAMMAFFLLLWLLNSVTQEQLEGISNYFAPASIAQTTSGAGGVLGGTSISQTEGAMNNPMSSSEVTVDLPPPKAGAGLEEETEEKKIDEETAEEVLEKKEQQQFEEAEDELRKTIESMPQLKQLVDSLMVDNTPEGMRIQIVDQDGLAMFPRGGSKMYLHTRRVLELVSEVINKMTQKMAISGHTDSVKFSGNSTGYTNWELSADRANACRSALIELGVDPARVARVVGRAATEPLLKDDPKHAKNRRISIVLLRGTGQPEQAAPPPEQEATPPPEQATVTPEQTLPVQTLPVQAGPAQATAIQ